jgi:methionyl-tRNA formyltransferase
VDWNNDCKTVYNHIRGLSPYPAAHTQLQSESGELIDLKIYAAEMETCTPNIAPGIVDTDNKKYLKIALRDGFIHLTHVQQAGKKAMPISDFLRGTQLNGSWKTATK